MSPQGPVFIDLFGKGKGGPPSPDGGPNWQPDEGEFWKLAWQGKVGLWKAFWVYFFFGHGVVLGIGFGAMVFSMLIGFTIDRGSIIGGANGLALSAAVLTLVFLVFAIWSTVSVWRCADNCTIKIRGTYARVVVVGYVTTLMLPAINYFFLS